MKRFHYELLLGDMNSSWVISPILPGMILAACVAQAAVSFLEGFEGPGPGMYAQFRRTYTHPNASRGGKALFKMLISH